MSPSAMLRGLRTPLARAGAVARAAVAIASQRHHPALDGVLEAPGLDAPLELLRDSAGVPHIYAASARDGFFGQGFVHAQDRLFQIDSMRRAAAGRLAEIAGERLLASDRFMRRLGLADRAGRDFAILGNEDRDLLVAYAAGVNAGIQTLPALPPEYAVLGVAPEPWHPEHSLLVARMILFTFATNWDTELLREQLLTAIGPERAAELDATYPQDARTASGESYASAAERLLDGYRGALAGGLPAGGASNAWAVSGARSQSAAPLLASDPHLQAQLPGLFHVAHLSGGEIDVIGAAIPGLPGVVIGHNGSMAWGVTAGLADVSDCYIETLDAFDATRYSTPGGWESGRTRIERISVLDGETVEERVLETRHGPVIGPAIEGETRAIALRSTALEPADLIAPFMGMARASTVEAFQRALDGWPGATFNVVWVHREGSIGQRLVGAVPQRTGGTGLLPQEGATSPGPTPVIPPEGMPALIDPPAGMVLSANNPPGGDLELGEEWCDRYRVERIAELLDAQQRHTIASMQAIQRDHKAPALVALRDLILAESLASDGEVAAVIEAWDGYATAGSAGAALLEQAYIEVTTALVTRLAGDRAATVLGDGLHGATASSTFHYRLQSRVIEVLQRPRAPWLDGAADRDRVLRAALSRAIEALRAQLGDDVRAWRWGSLHRLALNHPFAAVPVLGRMLSRGPYPYGGDMNTVNQGGFSIHDGPRGIGYSAAYRQVIDLAAFDRSTFSLPSGNCGIPGCDRYDDMIDEHLAGRQRPLLYSREAVDRHAQHRLRLLPPGEQLT